MQKVRVIEKQEIWDAFLLEAQPNTFLHSWQWGEFNKQMGERVWRLGVYNSEEVLVAVALIIKIKARRGAFLFCPHGPIADVQTLKHGGLSILTEYLKKLAKEENCGFVRFSPLMLATPENKKVWSDLKFRNAPTHMHPELSWLMDVLHSEEELLQNMRKTTRYSIRKAEKDGVEIVTSTEADDVGIFWSVYEATVGRHQFVPFSKKYLRTEFEKFAKDNKAMWFFGKYNNEIVTAALIIFEKWSGFYHHGASVPKYANLTASQLLQWHVILEAKRRGCQKYNFWGIAPENNKKHPWAGLSTFKKGFGGGAEEYVHAQDLPIKMTYWFTAGIEYLRRKRRRL